MHRQLACHLLDGRLRCAVLAGAGIQGRMIPFGFWGDLAVSQREEKHSSTVPYAMRSHPQKEEGGSDLGMKGAVEPFGRQIFDPLGCASAGAVDQEVQIFEPFAYTMGCAHDRSLHGLVQSKTQRLSTELALRKFVEGQFQADWQSEVSCRQPSALPCPKNEMISLHKHSEPFAPQTETSDKRTLLPCASRLRTAAITIWVNSSVSSKGNGEIPVLRKLTKASSCRLKAKKES